MASNLNYLVNMIINEIQVDIIQGDITTIWDGSYVVPQPRNSGEFTDLACKIGIDCNYAIEGYDILAKYTNLPFGFAVSFDAFGVLTDRIINVAAIGFPEDKAFELTQLSTYAVLAEAEKQGVKELVMPPIATGKGAPLKYSASAAAMLSAIAVFPSKGILKKITIPLETDGAYRYFCRGAEHYLPYMRYGLEKDYEDMVKSLNL